MDQVDEPDQVAPDEVGGNQPEQRHPGRPDRLGPRPCPGRPGQGIKRGEQRGGESKDEQSIEPELGTPRA